MTILRYWTVTEASYSHRHRIHASHLKFKKLRMLLVVGKYPLLLLGFRKWNWILFVLLIKDLEQEILFLVVILVLTINFCLDGGKKKRWRENYTGDIGSKNYS